MPKKKTEESRFVAFAMNAPVEQVRSVVNTMNAILAERVPKAAKATKSASRKPATATPTAAPQAGRAAAGSSEGQRE